MFRPSLDEVVIPDGIDRKFPECVHQMALEGIRTVTMSVGQWDLLLQMAYDEGWMLLELNEGERLVHVYQRLMS